MIKPIKLILAVGLMAGLLACGAEPTTENGETSQAEETQTTTAQTGEVIKSPTIAEGVLVGLRGNELQLDAKSPIMLPEIGNDSFVTIFILRPAETMGVKTSLSGEGQIRSSMLARTFAKTGIEQIYCEGNAAMQTALSTSKENACDLGLVKDDGTDQLTKTILKNFKGKRVMLVGSPRFMTDVIGQLAGADKYAVSSEDYDQIYVVMANELGNAEVHHLRY